MSEWFSVVIPRPPIFADFQYVHVNTNCNDQYIADSGPLGKAPGNKTLALSCVIPRTSQCPHLDHIQ